MEQYNPVKKRASVGVDFGTNRADARGCVTASSPIREVPQMLS